MDDDYLVQEYCCYQTYADVNPPQYHDDGETQLSPTVATLSLGSSATMRFRPKKNSTIGRGSSKKSDGNKKECISFTLNHGDMVVMHGTDIHKFYEVCFWLQVILRQVY